MPAKFKQAFVLIEWIKNLKSMKSRNINIVKNIAFVENDNRKNDLIEWSYFNKDLLMSHKIIATGSAGNILEGTLNMPVCKLSSGIFGYQELSAKISEGKVDVIIFFGDDPETQMNNNAFDFLMETALSNNIIIAKNKPTADFVLTSALMNKNYSISILGNSTFLKTM